MDMNSGFDQEAMELELARSVDIYIYNHEITQD